MATTKPLRLKIAKASSKPLLVADRPYVSVLVKVPFQSLEEEFTYSLPAGSEDVESGFLVSLPFGNHQTFGVVLDRFSESGVGGEIQQITKVLSKSVIFSHAQLSLAATLAQNHICSRWSFLVSMAPEFSKAGEKSAREQSSVGYAQSRSQAPILEGLIPEDLREHLYKQEKLRDLVILPTLTSSFEILTAIAHLRAMRGKVIIVLPDEKDLVAASDALSVSNIDHTILSSHLGKSERFAHYLEANRAEKGIFLTLRNGIFLHANHRDTFIVFNDVDESHYEKRTPTWNTREVALSKMEHNSIIFLSRSPSLETLLYTQEGKLSLYLYPHAPIRNTLFSDADGTVPTYDSQLRKALKRGNVLISVPRTGYINALACSRCRNFAECECGGKIGIERINTPLRCGLCSKTFSDWQCTWCSSTKLRAVSRGVERSAMEFGKSFPGVKIVTSSAKNRVAELEGEHTLVLATHGCEPVSRYEAIIILEAETTYSYTELRAQEDARSHWFELLSYLKPDGFLFFSVPAKHDISQAIMRSTPVKIAERELEERKRVNLAPYVQILQIRGGYAKVSSISQVLQNRDLHIFGLREGVDGKATVFVKIPRSLMPEIRSLLRSIIRIGIAKREEAISLRFDPYSFG